MTEQENNTRLWEHFCRLFALTEPEMRDRAALCRRDWPEECAQSIKIAEELCSDTFLFQLPWDMEQTQQPVRFDQGIRWGAQQHSDQEFTFQLNRHRSWVCLGQAYALTGNAAYAACFVRQLCDWLQKEPLRPQAAGTTWRTLEAGLRADYWVRAMALCAAAPAVTPAVADAFLAGLRDHARCLAENPRTGFSAKSNWGVMEHTGLYLLGWVLEDAALRGQAVAGLKRELATQVAPDGVQWEASAMYHNEVLMALMEVLRVAALCGDEPFTHKEIEAIRRMAAVTQLSATPAGHQPMTGDSDDTDVRDLITQAALLLRDATLKAGGFVRLDYESLWLYGSAGAAAYTLLGTDPPPAGLVQFASSGEVFWRSGWGADADWLHFKNGPLGGGHGHQDKLHLGLWLNGEEILADSGRLTYREVPLRYELKAARSHNVPLADGQEYAKSADAWTMTALPISLPNTVLQQGEFLFAEGSHTGFLPQGLLICRRILAVGADVIVIHDELRGAPAAKLNQYWHFGPDIRLQADPAGLLGSGRLSRFSVQAFSNGQRLVPEIGTAPYAPHYNLLQRTACAVLCEPGNKTITTFFVRGDAKICPEQVYNDAYLHPVDWQDAEGYVVTTAERRLAFVFGRKDVGNTCDLNGVQGVYGLGRTMVCDLVAQPPCMTVLQR